MNNEELLSAISDLLDSKLEQKLDEKLEQKLDAKLDEKLNPLHQRLDRVELQTQETQKILKDNVLPRLDRVELQTQETQKILKDNVLPRLDRVEQRTQDTLLILENDMQPRLRHMEACYVDAFQRFIQGSDLIDSLQSDVDTLKRTVHRHSMILQKFSLMPT